MLKELRRLFYPHSSNNYKAGILQPSGLCVLIAVFLLTQSFLNLSTSFAPGVLGFASDITPEEVIELTNKVRSENGLPPLEINEKLCEAARRKAADMFALNYWAHISPRGADPWQFILESDYPYLYAGENLARDFADAEDVINAWMNSPTHRDNIFNKKYDDIGVAVVDGVLQGQETTLVVQIFAFPQGRPGRVTSETAVQTAPVVEKKEAVSQEATPATILTQSIPEERQTSLLSGFDLTKSLSLAFAGLLFVVLALDGFVIYKKKAARASGHNFIHGTFVIILIVMILLSQKGMIL